MKGNFLAIHSLFRIRYLKKIKSKRIIFYSKTLRLFYFIFVKNRKRKNKYFKIYTHIRVPPIYTRGGKTFFHFELVPKGF